MYNNPDWVRLFLHVCIKKYFYRNKPFVQPLRGLNSDVKDVLFLYKISAVISFNCNFLRILFRV